MTNDRTDDKTKVDRNGTTFLVPFGISAVFIVLLTAWISMAGSIDLGSIMSRPNAPSVQK